MRKAQTRFLSVDLDIYSRSDLQPLLDALGRKVIVLHAGPVEGKRSYEAHVEAPTRDFGVLSRVTP